MPNPVLHRYPTPEALAEALAGGVAAVLAGAIATRGMATLAVSGGTTPKHFLERLSQTGIDWADVTVLLVDERWVPETSERSNGAMVRRHLLKGPAAAAHFLPLYRDADAPESVADGLSACFQRLSRPFDAVVLGMGSDGHTASFLPGADGLSAAIDPLTSEPITIIRAGECAEPRVTLSLPMLTDARLLALHIEGEEKMASYVRAVTEGPAEEMPVRAVLRAPRDEPVNVFWAP
ncbi:6-phosphogluconolactonase [Aurantimonas sp. VKM B-3413]|uniref:6-phosphogluconolactonase n=1 Tax=Aurantimonas sp. VKM B-3413 TaxID=2779401 RepID=UPI001E646960|nr:6-phosphogluconolactonase [Aurantimonas sp. VKM B-3413]MCB8837612.1 6-phosphogluconolactonase [Aurantimonas sp. VKM B-3413]